MFEKVIVFDLWQTLADSLDHTFNGYYSVLQKFSKTKSNPVRIMRFVESQLMTRSFCLTKAATVLCRHCGINDAKVIDDVRQSWKFSMKNYYLYDDSLETIKQMRGLGFGLALITNSTEFGWRAFNQKFFLSRYFDLLILSFREGKVKPDISLFAKVQNNLAAKEYWMIGDSVINDIQPAKSLGWRTALIDRELKYHNAFNNLQEITNGIAI